MGKKVLCSNGFKLPRSDMNNDYKVEDHYLVCTKQKPRTQIVRDVKERLVVTIENMEVERDKEDVDDYVLDVDEDFNVAKRKKRKSYKDVYKNTFKVLARTVKKRKFRNSS
ncbi:hypothetical protein Tco_0348433 [Tanacetum coccineum]